MSNHGHKAQINKKSCLFPEFDYLFGILSPCRCFSTKKKKKVIKELSYLFFKKWGMNK